MNQKIREDIYEKMREINTLVSEKENNVKSISYYNDFEVKGSNLAVKNVYIVEIEPEKPGKTADKFSKYEIYDKNNQLIATVSEKGKINFSQEFLEQLKDIDERYFEQLNLEDLNFELPEEIKENDIVLTKEELDSSAKNSSKDKEERTKDKESEKNVDREQDDENQEEKQEENEMEEVKKEKSAEALGINEEEIKSISTINPNEKITDKYNLIDIMPEVAKFKEISIVYSNSSKEGNGQFTVLGINQDGTREKVNSIDSIEGTTGNKNVISINADGSKVEEKQVKGLFRINARNRDDGISVSIGDYGMMNIDYVSNIMDKEHRRATPIRTKEAENQRVATAKVRENAGDSKEEMTKEGRIFKERQEEGVNPQSLDGIDIDNVYDGVSLEELKGIIKEKALEQDDMSKGELQEFIKSELSKSGLNLSEQEIEHTTEEIEEVVLDESRFPQRGQRM